MESSVLRPWGEYLDLYRADNVVFKLIKINPGESISYQTHKERGEFWYIAKGRGQFKFSTSITPLENYSVATFEEGSTVEIPVGFAHQIKCLGADALLIYEMQFGKCLESDIIRLEDPYSR